FFVAQWPLSPERRVSALWSRSGEFRGVNRNIRLDVGEFVNGAAVEPRDGPTKWHSDSADGAIVRIIKLRDEAADRRVAEEYEPREQAGFRVEAQCCRAAAGRRSLDGKDLAVVNRHRRTNSPVGERLLDPRGKQQLHLQPSAFQFLSC